MATTTKTKRTRTHTLRGPRTTPAMLAEHAQLVAQMQLRMYVTVAGNDSEPEGTITLVPQLPEAPKRTRTGR